MPAERIAMRHVREVLRLRTAGISRNEIARRLNLAPSTVLRKAGRPRQFAATIAVRVGD